MEGSIEDARAQLAAHGLTEEEVLKEAGVDRGQMHTEAFDPLHFLFCVAARLSAGDTKKQAIDECKDHLH